MNFLATLFTYEGDQLGKILCVTDQRGYKGDKRSVVV